ncbi:nucleoplasmin-2 isoform X2 [Ochotona princeps]|uniref:nucleoplasmin-2 isoform X2 n=1 Tax=Ochotona princeps TaxID=9978 RepID=UPI0027154826|nr:nucleoplasmin-2 isoform X2 [Ochotona princeps]
MNLSSDSNTAGRPVRTLPWGCELSQEKRTCTWKPRTEGKDCRLWLSTICLGEKAKDELHRVEVMSPAGQEDKKVPPITIACLQTSVLPMVALSEVDLAPPVTFQLRAGSGPMFLSGKECYETSDQSWEEEEEEEEEEDEEEEEEDEEDDDADTSLQESPVKPTKRQMSVKQASVAKKKLAKEDEVVSSTPLHSRSNLQVRSPVQKAKSTPRPKKPGPKK